MDDFESKLSLGTYPNPVTRPPGKSHAWQALAKLSWLADSRFRIKTPQTNKSVNDRLGRDIAKEGASQVPWLLGNVSVMRYEVLSDGNGQAATERRPNDEHSH